MMQRTHERTLVRGATVLTTDAAARSQKFMASEGAQWQRVVQEAGIVPQES